MIRAILFWKFADFDKLVLVIFCFLNITNEPNRKHFLIIEPNLENIDGSHSSNQSL